MKDIVIIGAGPVGLFAAFYGGMRGLNITVIDKLEKVGGQLTALYPEKKIYDVAGFNGIKAHDLVENLKEQLEIFKDSIDYELGQEVFKLEQMEDKTYKVITSKKEISTKTVIIAGGNGGFEPRKLGVDNEENLGIDYFIEDVEIYKDKDVLIFGGGDSAVDFSLMLENIAKSVHIVHRREQFRAHEESVNNLIASSVNINTPYTPKSIEKIDDRYKVVITSKDIGDKEVECDKVICNFGFISKLGPIENFGVNIVNNKIEVDSEQKTNLEGVFAIGDICYYPGKTNLIISGFGEGPTAIVGAAKYINPEVKVGTMHSTTLFEKK